MPIGGLYRIAHGPRPDRPAPDYGAKSRARMPNCFILR